MEPASVRNAMAAVEILGSPENTLVQSVGVQAIVPFATLKGELCVNAC